MFIIINVIQTIPVAYAYLALYFNIRKKLHDLCSN